MSSLPASCRLVKLGSVFPKREKRMNSLAKAVTAYCYVRVALKRFFAPISALGTYPLYKGLIAFFLKMVSRFFADKIIKLAQQNFQLKGEKKNCEFLSVNRLKTLVNLLV